MVIRNIDKMYFAYGYGNGFCHQCPHFRKSCWNKKATKKVVGYDDSGNEIVEYESFIACGLINKDFPPDSVPGQITFDDILERGSENGENKRTRPGTAENSIAPNEKGATRGVNLPCVVGS